MGAQTSHIRCCSKVKGPARCVWRGSAWNFESLLFKTGLSEASAGSRVTPFALQVSFNRNWRVCVCVCVCNRISVWQERFLCRGCFRDCFPCCLVWRGCIVFGEMCVNLQVSLLLWKGFSFIFHVRLPHVLWLAAAEGRSKCSLVLQVWNAPARLLPGVCSCWPLLFSLRPARVSRLFSGSWSA